MKMGRVLLAGSWVLLAALALPAHSDTCTTQGQMTPAQRQELMQTAQMLVGEVQGGDLASLRNNTLAAVANQFSGIAESANALRPAIAQAGLTVDALFAFDAQPSGGAAPGAQFFCSPPGSTMTVVLNFGNLPPGKYALAIVHATGVEKPQQISLVLAQDASGQWKLAGFFAKPLLFAGQDGIWYWSRARQYAQQHGDWAAYFYYQIASGLVLPDNFLSSPNTDKLQHEAGQVRPQNLPTQAPAMFQANGNQFELTRVDTTTGLGSLDLAIHYNADDAQAVQLRNPAQARQQVVGLMSAILSVHPELRQAFHGLWVYADQNGSTLFALELPMNQIPGGAAPGSAAGE
ncbi:MAG TPA: hypothetical protein VMD25_13990 [Acidobacteriaceae bacterium]|nr:hypothetical protein [Acidobacteriaceae bacterium]